MASIASPGADAQHALAPATARPLALSRWLLSVAFLVFMMVVVGGITRLTESGLSITEWKPLTGAIPPITEAQWLAEFEKYRRIPEYQLINKGMSLTDFKFIYFWEWIHRQLGRVIGLAFALPLAWFAWKRAVPKGYGKRLLALLALGALQGSIGWWMVASGLVNRTDVSHYRLAVHLLTALIILGGLVWTALDLLRLHRDPAARPARLTGLVIVCLAVLFIQLLFGAYTAGLNAGYVSNTWPLMNDRFYPEGVQWQGSGLATLTSDPFLVHWIHRWWAWVTVAALVVLARLVRKVERPASIALHSAFGVQIILGIATVMTGMNFWLAVSHQAVGALVVATAVWCAHAAGWNKATA